MGGFFDFVRRILGWWSKGAAVVPAPTPRKLRPGVCGKIVRRGVCGQITRTGTWGYG